MLSTYLVSWHAYDYELLEWEALPVDAWLEDSRLGTDARREIALLEVGMPVDIPQFRDVCEGDYVVDDAFIEEGLCDFRDIAYIRIAGPFADDGEAQAFLDKNIMGGGW